MTTPFPTAEPYSHSLVVVGSSAGGIEALSTLVTTLPTPFPAPIVVAQHLDPHHPSLLGEILARRSTLPVRMVTDLAPLEPGVVYVVPANRDIELDDHRLRLRADAMERHPKPSINRLFRSAAAAFGEQVIAVILTGTGTDGASGAHEVKAAGGTVIIENPQTAAYPDLPASLEPTTVDIVVDLDRIGPLLADLLRGARLPAEVSSLVAASGERSSHDTPEDMGGAPALWDLSDLSDVRAVLTYVQERSDIDFGSYKPLTILRRLQARMAATGVADLAAYRHLLEERPAEYQRLISTFLIKVTQFFRDPALFDAIRDQVLPALIAQARERRNTLRIWSAGCATGEEAYSLAILVAEALGNEVGTFTVQIFATDLDEEAIAFARRGVYPAAALASLTPERIAHAFTKRDGTYQIMPQLRRLVTFGEHDLGRRAPFPQIDLVLCRNALIYFTQALRTRALQLFAFALRDGGYLALGNAETPGALASYFAPAHPQLPLYRRQGGAILGPMPVFEDLPYAGAGVSRLTSHPVISSLNQRSPPPLSGAPDAHLSGNHPQPAARPHVLATGQSTRVRDLFAPQGEHAPTADSTTAEQVGTMLLSLSLGVVVVDRHYDIQAINRAALHLLGIFTPAIGEDLVHLAQSLPSSALRAAIDATWQKPEPPSAQTAAPGEGEMGAAAGSGDKEDGHEAVVTVATILGERRHLRLTCYPATSDRVVILIRDVTASVRAHTQSAETAERARTEQQAAQAREVAELREENARLKAEVTRHDDINRTLLEANQELAGVSLSLRATNQALRRSQEEAQAGAEEVTTLNEELRATNEELLMVNEELQATVAELRTANEDLRAREHEIEELTRHRAAAEERERLARDLHDTVIQQLFAASALAETIPKNWTSHRVETEQALQHLPRLTQGAVANLRLLLLELRPSELEHMPLDALLRQLGEAMAGQAGVPISVQIDGFPVGAPVLPVEVKVSLYRMVQEALTNAARYAHARNITVRLRPRLPSGVVLAVTDDGQGFDPTAIPPGHFGLTLLRERAQTVGAAVRVRSRPGQGTAIVIVWKGELNEVTAPQGRSERSGRTRRAGHE